MADVNDVVLVDHHASVLLVLGDGGDRVDDHPADLVLDRLDGLAGLRADHCCDPLRFRECHVLEPFQMRPALGMAERTPLRERLARSFNDGRNGLDGGELDGADGEAGWGRAAALRCGVAHSTGEILHWLDAETGSMVARTRSGESIVSPPIVVGETLFVLSEDGRLSAYRADFGSG